MQNTILQPITNQPQEQHQYAANHYGNYAAKKTSAIVQPLNVISTSNETSQKENHKPNPTSTHVTPERPYPRYPFVQPVFHEGYKTTYNKVTSPTSDHDEFIDVVNESHEHLRSGDLPNNTDSSISTQSSTSPRSTGSHESSPTGSSSPSGSATSPDTLEVQPKKKARTNYSPSQVQALEKVFHEQPYPDSDMMETLSKDLGIAESKIKVWFQNKRARWRRRAQSSMQHMSQFMPMSPVLSPVAPYGFMAPGHVMNTASSPHMPGHFYPYPGTMTSPSPSRVGNPALMQSPGTCRLQPTPGPLRTSPAASTQHQESHLPGHVSPAHQVMTSPHQLTNTSPNTLTSPQQMMASHQLSPFLYPYPYGSYPHRL